MKAMLFAVLLTCAVAADMSQQEKEELQKAKTKYETQMHYQGQWDPVWPKGAASLKRGYEAQVARIKSEFESNNTKPVMFLAPAESTKMKAALRSAKDDYLTQLQYQGEYPQETAELKHEYKERVAQIKSEYASQGVALMLLGESACGNEEHDLQEAKSNYNIQMGYVQEATERYHGNNTKEENNMKEEYAKQVRRIKSFYASKGCGATMMLLAAPNCGEEAGDLHEAKQDYNIQMTFQGAYPEEAKDLKQEYEAKVVKIKKQYATCQSGDSKALGLAASPETTGASLLLVTSVISAVLGAAITGVAMRVNKPGAYSAPLLA